MENKNYELSKKADELLREAGFTIWGRPKETVDSTQTWIESRMQTGAYSNSSERKRR